MLSNDVKKGRKGVLDNGWAFTMMDNMKGVVRMAEVEGFFTEIGSIYMHDVAYIINDYGEPEEVEFTTGQEKNIKDIKRGLDAFS